MPHAIPPHIKEVLQAEMPPGYKLWWIRGVLMDVNQVTAHPKVLRKSGDGYEKVPGEPVHFLRLGLRDVDASGRDKQGYAVDICPHIEFRDYRPQDRISLFGHEPSSAEFISYPRYMYHHDYGRFGPCFETHFVDQDMIPKPDFKVKQEGDLRDLATKGLGNLLGKVGGNRYTTSAQALNKTLPGGFNLEPLYEKIAALINTHVGQTPDAIYPCLNPRPENLKGGRIPD